MDLRRWTSLQAAVDWLSKFDDRGTRSAVENETSTHAFIGEIWAALSEKYSKYQIGGNDLPRCFMAAADQLPQVSIFTPDDLSKALASPMYRDTPSLRELVRRLWIPTGLLLELFLEKRWPVAPWLEEPVSPQESDRGELTFSGRGAMDRAIKAAVQENFAAGLPPGTSSQDRNDKIRETVKRVMGREPNDRTIQRALKKLAG